jgi:hypothetical protein
MKWEKHAYLVRKGDIYKDKEGNEKQRYIRVGEIWKSTENDQKFYKLYSTLTNDEIVLFSQRLEEK